MTRVGVLRTVGAGVVLLAALTTGACSDDGPGELSGAVRTPPLEVSEVSLPAVDDGGEQPMTMQAPPGELYLVYFGYTSCPDVCPTTMSDIRVALDDLPDELAQRVTVAMASVDPERDTGEVVADYLDHFFDRRVALRTDDPEALATAADAFGVQWEIAEHVPGEPYDVAHSAVTYVVDDTGTVAVEWPFGFDSAAMTSDLRILLEEENP